jgi:hydroxymethylbilane synthase
MTTTLRLATRASPLALWQANHVVGLLHVIAPDIAFELVKIETTGDQIRDKPLSQIGGDGLFTKQIQQALVENRADLAVHSLKDLPTTVVDGLILAAVPERGPSGDALVSNRHATFDALASGAVVGTSSVRRRAQLVHRRPDLRFVNIRGNVDTRLRKMAEQGLDALVLAEAGLRRLGLDHTITEVLDQNWMLPAVGQGALGLECRADDVRTIAVVQQIDHPQTSFAVRAERAMLAALGGGCQVPIGAATRIEDCTLTLRGAVLPSDGSQRISSEVTGAMKDAESIGRRLAAELLDKGAKAMLSINQETRS